MFAAYSPPQATTMRAIVHERYGPPSLLQLREVARPEVGPNDVLVRVRAASLNAGDWYAVTGLLVARTRNGLRKPSSPGVAADLAGVVEAVGEDVTRFRAGDEVFGVRGGALAEYVCVPEDRALVVKAPELTFEQAAAIPIAGLTALQGLRDKGGIQAGQQVLVNGASGGVGTFAVQLAKSFGAQVTAVCSTRNVEQARSLGAQHVVDYTQDDFTTSGKRYDLGLDVAGSRSWRELRRVLGPESTLVMVGAPKGGNRLLGPLGHIAKVRLASLRASQKVVFFIAQPNKEDLELLQQLVVAGEVDPVIERRYELRDAPEALAYLGEGHAQGKLVVTI
jgi:NADPH:quinone reductase-like Zn-dependent oxidoreductase